MLPRHSIRRRTTTDDTLRQTLTSIALQYPQDMVPRQLNDILRVEFHIQMALDAAAPRPVEEMAIADLGGGVGMFSLGSAAMGVGRCVLVDDFNDPANQREGDDPLKMHQARGVEIFSRDVVADGIADIPGTFDVVTTFESMEHWHHSPKRLFGQVVEKLNPGGSFILGVPNCSKLAKRILTPLGRAKWSTMEDWYEEETFRGHVREADVSDLNYIARDMGLRDIQVLGRNWLLGTRPPVVLRAAMRVLRRPSFCSDIYLIGKRP